MSDQSRVSELESQLKTWQRRARRRTAAAVAVPVVAAGLLGWWGEHRVGNIEAQVADTARSLDLPQPADPSLSNELRAIAALGPELAAHGARLPFLLKLLAAAEPLSLQAHPTPEQARAGFAREEAEGIPVNAYDRNYRDAFHKPELVVAVSDEFDALSGFRPLDEVAGVLAVLRSADAASDEPQAGALDLLAARLGTADPLRDTVEWLLRDGRGEDTGEAAWVVERITALAEWLRRRTPQNAALPTESPEQIAVEALTLYGMDREDARGIFKAFEQRKSADADGRSRRKSR